LRAKSRKGVSGKEKLEFIRTILIEAAPQIVDIWNLVEKVISSAVTLYNSTGVFKKS
jgi:hypothetical protein